VSELKKLPKQIMTGLITSGIGSIVLESSGIALGPTVNTLMMLYVALLAASDSPTVGIC
jgi:hypothetical protein